LTGGSRAVVAEALGTALLLAVVVGSGIMGERLAGGNVAIALLANSLATGFGLAALLLVFAPISGAHFNPLVTLVAASRRELPWGAVAGYLIAQVAGALAGVAAAHAMFGEPLFAFSTKVRAGPAQWWSEVVATFGLILVIVVCARQGFKTVAPAVGAYIAAAYWFTASTSFANPAVTIARAVTDTFAGIRPEDAPAFIGAQIVGAAVAAVTARWLVAVDRPRAEASPPRLRDRAPARSSAGEGADAANAPRDSYD
jgi:glycerol uptake facilitator-like aquaporin